ncbi:MAG TPA: hypothetical protein VJQ82_10265 [Terriglobales bacterium]|nr:hypothetical protein [Terriglobales bacterium]
MRPAFSRLFLAMLFSIAFALPGAQAQSRLTDKDIDTTLKNLQEDTKQFRDMFNSALKKSTVRKTSQEQEAKQMVKTFEEQLESTRHEFKAKHNVDGRLPAVLASRDKIDRFLSGVSLGDQTNSQWGRIKAQLNTLSKSFNMGS